MSSFVITCPNDACRRPLNLPATAVGQPLSCPHCGVGIAVAFGPDGQPTPPTPLGPVRRVPAMFLVPGFALIILGLAGAFANGYIAGDAFARPGADGEHARRMIDYLSDAEAANPSSKKDEDDPRGAFAAVFGQAMGVATQEQVDAARAESAAPWIGPFHAAFAAVSLLMAAGGFAILRGRWFWLAMAGSVAGIVNVSLCCCVPGLVAGLWGVLTISRDEGQRHFGRKPAG